MRAWILALVAIGCGGRARGVPDDLDDDLAQRADRSRELYTLWWSGARIGDAEEQVTRTRSGVELVRTERVQVRRGDRLAASRLDLEIHAGPDLVARTVDVAVLSDAGAWAGHADRAADGAWRLRVDGEPDRTADAAAVPAELVRLLVARDGRFAGPVLLAGSALAVARLTVEPEGDHHVGRLELDGVVVETRLELEADGTIARAAGGDGVVAVRASAADVSAPFDPPEVVDGTAIAVTGAVAEDADHVAMAIAPMPPTAPPALPGQDVAVDGDRWGVVLDPGLPGALAPGAATAADRTDDIVDLVRTVDLRLDEDLAVTAPTMEAARRATAGDCTTHALLFAALAGDAGIEVRLVTGFRLDGDRLVRHRWAVAWTGSAWMAVDPTHGEAPARGFLLGLAVHGARADEVATADETTFAGTGSARAKVQAR